jgi:pyruvate/2-oxoglutarate dehydrogenase complex dihydrolipoamide dehydrogenase (E3) component
VIVGGGAIGCEHASIFTALGARVTLIDGADRLLGYVDAELSRELRRIFESMGMDVRLGVRIAEVTRESDGLVVAIDDGTSSVRRGCCSPLDAWATLKDLDSMRRASRSTRAAASL